LRKRTLSPVRLVLEDSSKRSFMLFVVVSLQLGSIIKSNLIKRRNEQKSTRRNQFQMKQCRSCPSKHPYNQKSRCFYPRNEPQPRRVLVDSTRGPFFLLFTLLLNRRPSSKGPASSGAAKAACHWPRNPFSVQRSHSWRSST